MAIRAVARGFDEILLELHSHTAVHHLNHAILQSRGNPELFRLDVQRPLDLLLLREQTLLRVNRNREEYWNAVIVHQSAKSGDDDGGGAAESHLARDGGVVAGSEFERAKRTSS